METDLKRLKETLDKKPPTDFFNKMFLIRWPFLIRWAIALKVKKQKV